MSISEKKNTSGKKYGKKVMIASASAIVGFSVLSILAVSFVCQSVIIRPQNYTSCLAPVYSESDAKSYPRKEIEFCSDSDTLNGYIYGEGNTNGIVLVIHGMNSSSAHHLPEIKFFVDNGWVVFGFDGCDENRRCANILIQLSRDVSSAIEYLQSSNEYRSMPIVLFGHSLGAYAASCVLGEYPSVRSAVCISGFNSPTETMKYFSEKYVGKLAVVSYPYVQLYNFITYGTDSMVTAVDGINSTDKPVFIVCGDDDSVIPYELSILSHRDKITNTNVRYLLIDSEYRNGHSNSWLSREAGEYLNEMTEELESLDAHYSGDIPDDEEQRFVQALDTDLLSELDYDFMNEVNNFFIDSLK